jgi:dihydrofolate reductase
MVSLLVAYGRNRAIGKDNKLPWHLPADLTFFKRTTMGHTIIMGRNTFASIGKLLPGRTTLVVSRSGKVSQAGLEVFSSLGDALAACAESNEIFVIGGAQLFDAALPVAQRIYATEIQADFAADTFFPLLDSSHWRETSRKFHAADEKNAYAMDFVVYDRVAEPA